MVNKQIIVLVLGVVVLRCIDSQIFPANPCPNLFQYFQNNGIVYGRMEFPNDLSGYYRLSVNMSVATYLTDNKNIRLELRTSANELSVGRPVAYNVYFPIQSVIPKPTRIEFNRRVYCAGPPEELRPGSGVTNMWASTYFGITGPIRPTRPNSVNEIEIIEAVPQFSFTLPTVPSNPEFSFTLPTVPSSFWIPTEPTQASAPSTNPKPTKSPSNVVPEFPFTLPTLPSPFWAPTQPTQASTTSTTPTPTKSTNAVVQAPFTSAPKPSKAPTVNVVDRNPNPNEGCGVSSVTTQQLVVNGDNIEDGQYPWMVALMYRQNFDYKYRCTGSLVSDRHVLTAAHCVQFYKAPLIPIEDLLLVFGKNNIKNWANGAVIRDVQNMTVHPDYKQNQGDCDIAVLTMSKIIIFQTTIRPVCLWQEADDLDLIVGKQGTVVGWGMDETGKDFVTEAKKINLPIVSQVTCLRSDPGFSSITSSRTFCAGNRNGSGPCTGDSGAGFVMNRDGKWILRGVVSTALGDANTCDLNNYFVFADAAKVKSWIREAMA